VREAEDLLAKAKAQEAEDRAAQVAALEALQAEGPPTDPEV
jgi:hypothetical protein